MSCIIDSGISRGCRNNASGVVDFYIANYPSGTTTSLDFLTKTTGGTISDLSGLTTSLSFYQYTPNKLSSKADEEYGVSDEFGSVTYMQKLSMVFAGVSQEMQNQIKALTAGSFLVIVRFKNGKYFLFGESDSISVTGGSMSSGQKSGELVGYSLEMSAEEGQPSAEVDAACISAHLV